MHVCRRLCTYLSPGLSVDSCLWITWSVKSKPVFISLCLQFWDPNQTRSLPRVLWPFPELSLKTGPSQFDALLSYPQLSIKVAQTSTQLMFFLRRLFHCTSRNAYCTSTIWCAEQWVFKAAFWPDYSNDDHELPQIGSHTRHSSHNKLQTMLFLQNIVKCDKKWPSFVWPHILLTVSVQPSIHTRTEKKNKKNTRMPITQGYQCFKTAHEFVNFNEIWNLNGVFRNYVLKNDFSVTSMICSVVTVLSA